MSPPELQLSPPFAESSTRIAYLLAPDCAFHVKVYAPAVIDPEGLNPVGVETVGHTVVVVVVVVVDVVVAAAFTRTATVWGELHAPEL